MCQWITNSKYKPLEHLSYLSKILLSVSVDYIHKIYEFKILRILYLLYIK